MSFHVTHNLEDVLPAEGAIESIYNLLEDKDELYIITVLRGLYDSRKKLRIGLLAILKLTRLMLYTKAIFIEIKQREKQAYAKK